MSIQQFLFILRARYLVVVITLAVVTCLTAVISILQPKRYTASASLVLDVKSPDPVSGQMLPGMMAPGYMATQVEILQSDRVATSVVRSLKLDQSPSTRENWLKATEGKGQLVDWLAGVIQRDLEVKPSRESNVINISYSGSDPQFAAVVANAFAQAYIDVSLDLRLSPARQFAAFFDEQTKAARERLEKSQQALSAYQQKNGIVSVDDRLDIENAKLNEISSQLTAIQGQTTDSQSKRLSGKTDTLAEVMQNPLINSLKVEINRLEARIQESSVNLGRNHPQTQRMESELTSLTAQLSSETRKVTNSINTTYEVSRQRERQLREALLAQKSRVLELNNQRDEIIVLKREVELAQRAFDILSQRASQTNVESQATLTNISVLNPATQPLQPSRPRITFNILISVFLGTLLGVSVAVGLELLFRRVRSSEDIQQTLHAPLLGSLHSAGAMLRPAATGVRT